MPACAGITRCVSLGHDLALEEASVASIHAAYASGSLTCRALVEAYLSRIAAFDQRGPRLNAVITINPRALEIAETMDAAWRENRAALDAAAVDPREVARRIDLLEHEANEIAGAGLRVGEADEIRARLSAAQHGEAIARGAAALREAGSAPKWAAWLTSVLSCVHGGACGLGGIIGTRRRTVNSFSYSYSYSYSNILRARVRVGVRASSAGEIRGRKETPTH